MEKIKLGVFGMGTRGRDLARDFLKQGCQLVAMCEARESELKKAVELFGEEVACYTDFDSFIEHNGIEIVLLANNFQEHAPYAIRCLKKGIHVFSECISNGTMAEGVELIEAFESSNAIYMLAENYPQMVFNREIQRVCKGGSLGRLLYAEGEYNHPTSPNDINFAKAYNYSVTHWRNYTPSTYYVTHSLGPIMAATGATPKRVTCFSIFEPISGDLPTAKQNGDIASIMVTQNDDGSVFRFTGCASFGAHHKSYRICGTNGQIENIRGDVNKIMLRYNDWQIPDGMQEVNSYNAVWSDDVDVELAKQSGHGGADYLTVRIFLDCVRNKKQPAHPFDVYSAVAMSSVAILAHRSALQGGIPFEIPDFRDQKWRDLYREDRKTPYFSQDGSAPNMPCCSKTDHHPTEKQLKLFKEALGIKD